MRVAPFLCYNPPMNILTLKNELLKKGIEGELVAARERVAMLEKMLLSVNGTPVSGEQQAVVKPTATRRPMSEKEKREVSKRMKAFWAAKRKAKEAKG